MPRGHTGPSIGRCISSFSRRRIDANSIKIFEISFLLQSALFRFKLIGSEVVVILIFIYLRIFVIFCAKRRFFKAIRIILTIIFLAKKIYTICLFIRMNLAHGAFLRHFRLLQPPEVKRMSIQDVPQSY